ncbi:hypothetical protein [Burkholderia cepacia]|uniref:hypothetical protein n=1 Tax=Burkholderia cepacia TaxID=292 RepID=UPI000F5DBEAA|nr:hypothetical protein [Burkholderia cepacia]RRA01924.1 hypothetical protein DF055_20140 [Burkholderia cepacia]RRA04957.1 hypothetical protein DF054_22940 [Burkholderia cepacia]
MSERIGITRNGNVAFSIELPDDWREFEFVVRKRTEVERFTFRKTADGALQIGSERFAGGGAPMTSTWSSGGGGGAGGFAGHAGGGASGSGGFPIDKSSIKYTD